MNEMPEAAILVLHFQGESSPDQDEKIRVWRNSAAENETVYVHLRQIWELAGHANAIPEMNLDHGWSRLSATLGLDEKPTVGESRIHTMPATNRKRSAWPLTLAALFAAALLWLWVANPLMPGQSVYTTAAGEQREVTLEDGSKVWLDSASTLTHVNGFRGKTRLVTLEGHAFFDVRKGEKSFIVQTPTATVSVLGTEFDVWAGNGKTKVIVREGRVSLRGLSGRGSVELGPNQYSECTSHGEPLPPMVFDVQNLLAWLQGSRVYHSEPLADVALDLGRLFGTAIEISDTEMAQQTITATFRDESLTEILEEICLTLNMEYIEKEGGYILNPVR